MPFPTSHPALARALDTRGYKEPTPVQAAVLEAEADRDLLVSAQTGSGKTVAFGLAAAPALLGEAERFDRAGAPLALVIAPTRELALQVARELEWLYADAGGRIVTCVGGMDARAEQRALNAGAHMVVGTPGRLRDHLERGNLDLSGLRVVVLDEADEMLDMGFREDLEAILDAAPSERRTFLFSATIAKEIAALAKRYQRDAVRIDTVRRNKSHSDIEHRAIRVAPNDVEHAIVNLLRYFEGSGALIFCATREAVRHLHATLRERGFGVVQLSGELSQKERADALQALRDGHARACVATDVAARGLDLPELGLVIHAALPANTATLLHRSGRTGRAGRKGVSVLLVPHNKRRQAERLIDVARVDAVWSGAPTPDEIRARDQDRMLQDPLLTAEAGEEELTLARRLIEERGPEAVAAALVRLYRSRLPEPEDLFDDGRPSAPERREPRAPADQVTEGAWFRLPVGRAKNADPKWLVPLICRLGHVTKADIGVIRIFDNETKFQIAEGAEARFQEASRAAADAGEMRIQPTTPPAPQGPRPSGKPRFGKGRPNSAPTDGPRPPRRDGPHRDGPRPPRREGGPRPPRKPRRDA